MNWTALGVIIGLATLVLAVLDHKFSTIKFMTTLGVKMDQVYVALTGIDKELEKRDAAIKAIGSKVDGHEHRITVVETKIGGRP